MVVDKSATTKKTKNLHTLLDKPSVHDLRHSFGSELIKQNVDIKVISKLMGHADVTTTYNIYIHILDEQCCSAVDIFNASFIKADKENNRAAS